MGKKNSAVFTVRQLVAVGCFQSTDTRGQAVGNRKAWVSSGPYPASLEG